VAHNLGITQAGKGGASRAQLGPGGLTTAARSAVGACYGIIGWTTLEDRVSAVQRVTGKRGQGQAGAGTGFV
jgi:hypothetical protein